MAISATITLPSPGADTGPFDLRSNADSYATIFDPVVPKSSLLTGYTSNVVPDGTTIIRVQSSNLICSNYIDLSISGIPTTTTTTTTTTVYSPCTPVGFAYDAASPVAACASGSFASYYLNPSTLAMWEDPFIGIGGCYGTNAAVGYYSDHTDYYYYDGTQLLLQGACSSLTTTVNVYLKRATGTNISLSVGKSISDPLTTSWSTYSLVGTARTVTTSSELFGSFTVPIGSDIAIGVKRTGSLSNLSFKQTSSSGTVMSTVYCNWLTTTNLIYPELYLTLNVYLVADVAGTSYTSCVASSGGGT